MGARTRSAGRGAAIGASVLAHASFLAAIAWRLGATASYPETPVINVELTPLRRERPQPATAPKPEISRPSLHIPPPSAVSPPPASPVAPAPLADGRTAELQRTLRGALGCRNAALLGLTPEERRACEARMAAIRRDARPVRLDLDPRGRFAGDAEPYLARKPKDGCKLRAAGDADPMGKQGPATGVACAWSF